MTMMMMTTMMMMMMMMMLMMMTGCSTTTQRPERCSLEFTVTTRTPLTSRLTRREFWEVLIAVSR